MSVRCWLFGHEFPRLVCYGRKLCERCEPGIFQVITQANAEIEGLRRKVVMFSGKGERLDC